MKRACEGLLYYARRVTLKRSTFMMAEKTFRLICQTCGVTTSSEHDFRSHMRGRVHQNNLDKISEAERSIYVKGFHHSSVTEESLRQCMSRSFGEVKSVWINTVKHYAIVQFQSQESALQALRKSGAVELDRRKLIIKPRNYVIPSRKPRHHFRQKDDKMAVEQSTSKSAVTKRTNLSSEIEELLMQPNPLEEQIKLLAQRSKMPHELIRAQLVLCHVLQIDLREEFPDCMLVPFGATVSGHGTITSDCDVCLMTNPSEQIKRLLSPPNYYPPEVLAIWREITGKTLLPLPPPSSTTNQLPPHLPSTASIPPPSSTIPPGPSTTMANLPPSTTPSNTAPYTTTSNVPTGPSTSTSNMAPSLLPHPPPSSAPAVPLSLPLVNRTDEEEDDEEDSLSNMSLTSTSSSASPSPNPKTTKKPPEFDRVLSVINRMWEMNKILPLPHARCPIIRFLFEPSNLHCDLSFNNRLGPYNTRLMQAYYNFDPRFPLLIPVVRLWIKTIGPPRTQINNYTVSLMLIFALQHCNPPVLPCLQDPGAWPKNMAWFSEKGFAVPAKREEKIVVGKWRCGFTPPESLLPSTNTESTASLLLHFFKFYSEFRNVVAIHCPPDKTLTVNEATELSNQAQSGSKNEKVGKFAVSVPLCVQDPFELSHNLLKSLSKLSFAKLTANMKSAATVLAQQIESKEGSLLEIFNTEHYKNAAVRVVSAKSLLKTLFFSKDDIAGLLGQIEELKELANRLDELDLSNKATLHSLCLVVLRALATRLETEMKFVISPVQTDEAMEEDDDLEETKKDMEEDNDLEETKKDTEEEMVQEVSQTIEQPAVTKDVSMEEKAPDTHRKRQRSEAEEEEEDSLEANTSQGAEDKVVEEEIKDDVKRCKTESKVAALDLLQQLTSSGGAESYLCTAFENTWMSKRRNKRHPHHQQQQATRPPLLDALPALNTPVIHLQLSLKPLESCNIESKEKTCKLLCAVGLNPLEVQSRSLYGNWFSVFKRMVMVSHSPDKQQQQQPTDVTDK